MTMTFGYCTPEWIKREALRRRMRALGIHAVPPASVLDRIVEEHEVAAALVGRSLHDELCERWACDCGSVDKYGDDLGMHGTSCSSPVCYCAERHDALERIVRRLDAASDSLVAFDQSVTTETEEGPR